MLSVIIATEDSERLLLPTLSALVPGALAGVVREVIVADAGSRDETAAVADVAGCRIVVSPAPLGARLKSSAAVARGSWLLFLKPGAVPDASWVDNASHFVQDTERGARADAQAAVFRSTPATRGPPAPGSRRCSPNRAGTGPDSRSFWAARRLTPISVRRRHRADCPTSSTTSAGCSRNSESACSPSRCGPRFRCRRSEY